MCSYICYFLSVCFVCFGSLKSRGTAQGGSWTLTRRGSPYIKLDGMNFFFIRRAAGRPSSTMSSCGSRSGAGPHKRHHPVDSGGALRADREQRLVFVFEEDSHGK